MALRVVIGLHFFTEGAAKQRDPKPYSAGFLGNAKGPLAPLYHNMVWDKDGYARLNKDATVDAFTRYRQDVANHYGFDAGQQKKADATLARFRKQINWFFSAWEPEIHEFLKGVERVRANSEDAARSEVESLVEQSNTIASDVRSQKAPLLGIVDVMWSTYESQMNDIATLEQRRAGELELPRAGRRWLDSESIDVVIRWFDLIIGALLILGLFSRTAATAGAIFLLSVCLSQWPGSPGALPIWPQLIEMLGLWVLAALAAGNYAGLDFLIHAGRMRCCPPQQKASSE